LPLIDDEEIKAKEERSFNKRQVDSFEAIKEEQPNEV